jgi:hypothetical protein
VGKSEQLLTKRLRTMTRAIIRYLIFNAFIVNPLDFSFIYDNVKMLNYC